MRGHRLVRPHRAELRPRQGHGRRRAERRRARASLGRLPPDARPSVDPPVALRFGSARDPGSGRCASADGAGSGSGDARPIRRAIPTRSCAGRSFGPEAAATTAGASGVTARPGRTERAGGVAGRAPTVAPGEDARTRERTAASRVRARRRHHGLARGAPMRLAGLAHALRPAQCDPDRRPCVRSAGTVGGIAGEVGEAKGSSMPPQRDGGRSRGRRDERKGHRRAAGRSWAGGLHWAGVLRQAEDDARIQWSGRRRSTAKGPRRTPARLRARLRHGPADPGRAGLAHPIRDQRKARWVLDQCAGRALARTCSS